MATVHGYVGDFLMISDATNTSDITAEVTGTANAILTSFFTTLSDVDITTFTVTASDEGSDVTQREGTDYLVRGTGEIVFGTAPIDGAKIKATYTAFKGGTYITAGGFTSWSLSLEADVPENTVFNSTGWRTFAANGLKGWTCTAERHWVNDVYSANLAKRVLVRMYTDRTNSDYYYGWGVLSGAGPTTEVSALVDESITFQGTHLMGSITQ